MSEADRRRDPRVEPIDDERASVPQIERPFEREGPPSTKSRAADPLSTSEVRAIPAKQEAPPPVVDVPPKAAPAPSIPDLIDFERPLNVTNQLPSAPIAAPAATTDNASDEAAPANASLRTLTDPDATGAQQLLTTVEHLLDQARWSTLVEVLGPDDRVDQLPPHFAVVYALARAEAAPDDPTGVELMIRTTARAHGIPASSPIARVLAKRVVRRSPPDWRKRPAPRSTISILILFVALVLGGGGGFWLSNTKVQLPLPSFMQAR